MQMKEYIIPTAHGDISNLIRSILRLIDMLRIDFAILKDFDWKQSGLGSNLAHWYVSESMVRKYHHIISWLNRYTFVHCSNWAKLEPSPTKL